MGPNVLDKEQRAAVIIQSNWRGRRDRLRFMNTLRDLQVTKPATIPAYVSGNEPEIPRFSPMTEDKPYVFVGTAGLQNLQWICAIHEKPLCVPKFFLVDYSVQVVAFWHFVKDAMVHSNSYAAFNAFTKHFEKNLSTLISQPNSAAQVIEMFHSLESIDIEFNFLKELICKMTIVRADWRDKKAFEFIRQRTDQHIPIMVYASNIIEFLGNDYDPFQRDFVLEEGENSVTKVLNSIAILAPEQTIHSRTSRQAYQERGGRIRPDCFIFIPKHLSLDQQLTCLSAPEYGSLFKMAAERNLEESASRLTL